MSDKGKRVNASGHQAEATVKRARPFGKDDRAARESQRRHRPTDGRGTTHEVDRVRGERLLRDLFRRGHRTRGQPHRRRGHGRAGTRGGPLVSGYIPPVDVRVRLFMDMGYNPGFTGMAQMRGKVRRWLSWPGGGSLVLPDDPEIEYRDAMLVGASDWSNLFEAGECTLTFTLFDPIGWGAERVERTSRFEVGGDWPTLPEFRVVASAGSYLQVSLPSAGKGIRVDYDFAGGEAVVIDCQGETVLINDVDARDCVALASDFFALEPGDCIVSTSNCTYVETRFSERWA